MRSFTEDGEAALGRMSRQIAFKSLCTLAVLARHEPSYGIGGNLGF